MKLIVTSLGETMESPVDQRFGRARHFILYDTETQEWSAHDNKQNLEAAQGAGIQAGQKAGELGAEAVITGHCGPKAFQVLTAGGIKVFNGAEGSAADAIEQFKAGRLTEADGADVQGHWM